MQDLIQAQTQTNVSMWEDPVKLAEIKNIICPNAKLTETEWELVVGLGRATGLNPFLKQIWAIKYKDGGSATIMIGRDGYRLAAQRHPEYDYHQSDAVYSNDKYEVINGIIHHSYNLADRGKLVGAYCVAKRRSSSVPSLVYVDLKEYDLGQSLWKTKPATMCKKVAESQVLRMAFQDMFSNTYSEDELDNSNKIKVINEPANEQSIIESILIKNKERKSVYQNTNVHSQLADNEPRKENIYVENTGNGSDDNGRMEHVSPSPQADGVQVAELKITTKTISKINTMIELVNFPDERLDRALKFYNVVKIDNMTEDQGQHFIAELNKLL